MPQKKYYSKVNRSTSLTNSKWSRSLCQTMYYFADTFKYKYTYTDTRIINYTTLRVWTCEGHLTSFVFFFHTFNSSEFLDFFFIFTFYLMSMKFKIIYFLHSHKNKKKIKRFNNSHSHFWLNNNYEWSAQNLYEIIINENARPASRLIRPKHTTEILSVALQHGTFLSFVINWVRPLRRQFVCHIYLTQCVCAVRLSRTCVLLLLYSSHLFNLIRTDDCRFSDSSVLHR